MWAMAALFHMAKSRIFPSELLYVLLTGAAIFLLFKPSSLTRLLLFLSIQLMEAFIKMPGINNHWIFTTFVNLTIVHALLYLVIKRKSFRVNKGEFLETFAPLVRVELIILYFFAVFHKLNTGFFSTATSCATDFFIAQNSHNLLPNTTAILSLNAYGTIAIEALIPLLLIFRATRSWGIYIGLIFHCVIAYSPINGFFDFSSMIFALYFLFSSNRFSDQIYSAYQNLRHRRTWWREQMLQQYNLTRLVGLLGLFIIGLFLIKFLTSQFDDYFRYVCWTAYSFAYIIIFMVSMFRKGAGAEESKPQFALPHWSLLIIPLVVFINGLSPYLGLKTETSYAMFSNLRTEGGISNHLLVPAQLQVFDFQKDMVEVISSSDPKLQKAADSRQLMVFFRFKNYVAGMKPEHITYIRNGQLHTFSAATAPPDDELLHKNSYALLKLLKFRNISKYDPQPCAH